MADRPGPHGAEHPTPLTYVKAAAILTFLTALEVAVFYIDVLQPAFLPIFIILSIAKFVIVIMFYMHLRFDSRLFSGVFIGGLLLAIAVVITLLALFQVISAVASPRDVDEEALVKNILERQPVEEPEPEVPTPAPDQDEPSQPDAAATTEPGTTQPTPTSPAPVAVSGDPAAGEQVFMNVPDNAAPQALWCNTCHQIEGLAAGLIGPDLTHIATDAANRISGMSAAEYIRQSIMEPDSFIPEGVERATAGLMTPAITENLTDKQVEDLVAFLLQQE
jgi:cytochrome c oxidase subunit 4